MNKLQSFEPVQIALFDDQLNAVIYDAIPAVAELPTASPINAESLRGQNAKVLNYLKENGTITMLQAHTIGVMHLHSRISDLRNRAGMTIYDRFVRVNGIDMKEYSLKPFNNNEQK